MSIEYALPEKDRLNSTIDEFRYELDHVIQDTRDVQAGDIVSIDYEFESVRSLNVFKAIAITIDKFKQDGNDARVHAIYRGLIFGYSMACEVYGNGYAVDFGHIKEKYMSQDDIAAAYDAYFEEVQSYLAMNSDIDAFIGSYVDEIDQDRDCLADVELAVGLILMLAEREFAKTYIEESADQLTPELFGSNE